jgi:serine/threonine protein kinase
VLAQPTGPTCTCGVHQPAGGWPADALIGAYIEQDRYYFSRRLGVGGFAVVYEAVDRKTGKHRAIKVLDAGLSQDAELRARFSAEATAMTSLVHPNIVGCHDSGLIDGTRPFIVLDLLRGRSLFREVVGDETGAPRTLSVERTLSMGMQLASALTTAHSRDLLHRDLNPNNVMILDDVERDWVRIIDFGMAKVLGKNTLDKVTRHIAGTPDFMAPEQFAPGRPLDARLDLWQLGALLYFALTGAPPYPPRATLRDVLLAVHELLTSAPESHGPRPSALNAELRVHGDLDDLIAQLLAPHPDARLETASEVLEKLHAIADLGDGSSRKTIKLDDVRLVAQMRRATCWFCPSCQTPIGGENIKECSKCGHTTPSFGWPQDKLIGVALEDGRFKLLRRFAATGLGDTYVVHDKRVGEERSLAIFNRYGGVQQLRELIVGPLQSLVGVDHPNIVRCYEVGVIEELDVPYMLLAVPNGRTVEELVWPRGALFPRLFDPAHAAGFGCQIAMALAALHEIGRPHGLLDPTTVLIGDSSNGRQAQLTSHGFAELLHAVSTTHTLEANMGWPEYMPSEHFNAESPQTARADLYQLGALLYFMLTGWPPFAANRNDPRARSTPYVVFQKQVELTGELGPRVSAIIPSLRAFGRLEQLISELLATTPEHRPGSALAVAERLLELSRQ